MDVYSTHVLNRVVETMFRPQKAILGAFFGEVVQSEVEDIYFDLVDGDRRIAPFVSPMVQGKIVESLGHNLKNFKPAYIKIKTPFDPNKSVKRMAGERIGGDLTMIDRASQNLLLDLQMQADMISRRKELMAVEVLRRGKCLISGEDYATVDVNFQRLSEHTETLTSGDRWGQSGVNPVVYIEDKAALVLKNSGSAPTDCIMDLAAWRLFRADPTSSDAIASKYFDTNPLNSATSVLNQFVSPAIGLQYQGQMGGIKFWTYQDHYKDSSGVVQQFMPANTMILASTAVQGVQHHGAIKDLKALSAQEIFVKSWEEEDPSIRYVMSQSAPLVVPYNPNATFCSTVA